MSIADWLLFAGFLSIVAAGSWRDGKLVDHVWFVWVNPMLERMQDIAEQFEQEQKNAKD